MACTVSCLKCSGHAVKRDLRSWLYAQPDELNLLEDGLQLWLIALRNAPAQQPWLLDLFSNVCAIMEKSTGGHPL